MFSLVLSIFELLTNTFIMKNTIKKELIKVQQSSVFRVMKRKVLLAAIGIFTSYSVFATQPKEQELSESKLFAIQPAGQGLNECGLHASVRMHKIINGVVRYDTYYYYFNSVADAEQYIAENTNSIRGGVLACYATGPTH